jgi:hypothetical protein
VVALWGRHKASPYIATQNIKEPDFGKSLNDFGKSLYRVYGGSSASEAPTRRCIPGGASLANRQSSVHKRGRR